MPPTHSRNSVGRRTRRKNNRQKRPQRPLRQQKIPHQRKTPPLLKKQPALNRPKRPLNRQKNCRLSRHLGHGPKSRKSNSRNSHALRRKSSRSASRTAKVLCAEVRTNLLNNARHSMPSAAR